MRACQHKDLKGREWRSAWERGREREKERVWERERALWLFFLHVFSSPGPALCKLG